MPAFMACHVGHVSFEGVYYAVSEVPLFCNLVLPLSFAAVTRTREQRLWLTEFCRYRSRTNIQKFCLRTENLQTSEYYKNVKIRYKQWKRKYVSFLIQTKDKYLNLLILSESKC